MNTGNLSSLDLTGRLALTLLHFLWQGAAVAAALVVVGGLLRVRRPAGRYALDFLALVAMAACPLLTFWSLRAPPAPTPPTGEAVVLAPADEVSAPVTVRPAPEPTSAPGASVLLPPSEEGPTRGVWLEAVQGWVVLGWVVGVALLGGRLLLGWAWLRRLKHCLEPGPDALLDRAEKLCRALRLRLPRLYLCRHVREAVATGLIRPVILLPASWLTELPPDMLEAVLAHELAHLRRGDLWVNLFQRLTETLLFYHPAVWWLSRRLRVERELCCDEEAVAVTRDRLRYAQTLERVGRLVAQSVPSGLALSIGGSRMTLLLRVQHLLGPRPVEHPAGPWLAGLLAVAAPAAAWWLTLSAPAPHGTAAENPAEVTGTVVDTQDRPVAGLEVQVYRHGRRTEPALRTDAGGRLRVPAAWRVREEDGYSLVARARDRLGWFDFSQNLPAADAKDLSFRVVLLPLDQAVSGALTDAQGKPLPGTGVEVVGFAHDTNRFVYAESLPKDLGSFTTVTDREGRFSVTVPAGTAGQVRPRHADWASVWIPWKKGGGDVGRVQLEPGGRVEGRVLDARTGRPVASASVGAQGYNQRSDGSGWGQAVSDPGGRFVIGGLRPDQYNVLFLRVPDNEKLTASAAEAVTIQAGKPARVDFRVGEGRLVTGKVIEADTGKPMERCHVGYYGAARPRSGAACLMVRTDARGGFQFRVPPGVSYLYVAEGNRTQHPDSTRTIEVKADRDQEPLVLKAGPVETGVGFKTFCVSAEDEKKQREAPSYRLKGVFRTSDGRPVTQVELRLVYQGSRYTSEWSGRSGPTFETRFSADNEGRKAFYLVEARGFAPARSPEFTVTRIMAPLTIDLQPPVYAPVRGRVVDREGKPVTGARVRSGRILYYREEEYPWGVEATTDEEGRFELRHVRVGDRFYVHIDRPGTGGAESERVLVTKPGTVTLPDLTVSPPNRTVTGRVIDADGQPIPGAKVAFQGDPAGEATADGQGRFDLRGLPAGRVSLTITAPGYQSHGNAVPAGAATATLHAYHVPAADRSAFRLPIRLRPKDGKTVRHTEVWFVNQEGPRLEWSMRFAGNQADTDLESSLRRRPEQTYLVVVAAEGYAQPKAVTVKARKNPEPVVIDLEPAPAVKLRGRVLGENGKPLAGVKVGLSRGLAGRETDEPWRYLGSRAKVYETDAGGRFEIAGVPPGSRVAVYINKPGYAGLYSPRVTAEKAADVQLPDLVLKKSTRDLTGRVVDGRGRPVAGTRVTVQDFGQAEATTDADGRFRLQGVPDRETVVVIDSPKYQLAMRLLTPDTRNIRVVLEE